MSESEEVWGYINRLAEAMSIQAAVADLIRDINNLDRWTKKECGNCCKWMTNNCPYERNVNGRKKGPSMGTSACGEFIIKELNMVYRDREKEKIRANKNFIHIKESYLINIGFISKPKEIMPNC